MGIRVLDPGSLTTVQDKPRLGLARYGLSEAGPMAPVSFMEANYLAGNSQPLPCLEVTMKLRSAAGSFRTPVGGGARPRTASLTTTPAPRTAPSAA